MVLVERSHPSNSPNSDRTPPTSQTAIAPFNSQIAIASPQLPNSDRTPSTSQKAIAPPQLPNSDRTPSTPQTAIALPPTSQTFFF
jgi:hypothetical protein